MKLTKAQRLLLSSSLSVFLVGCGSPNYSQSDMHMTVEEADSTKTVEPARIPALVKASPTAPVLSNAEDSSTFDIVVTSVPVRDLLFALARDANVNMDIDDEVGGYVSLSALDQTLEAILARIGEQVAIRVERVGDAIIVKPDKPYHKYYQVDFLNVNRTYSSSATAGGVGDTGTSSVSNTGGNTFWAGLEASIAQILAVGFTEGQSAAVVDRTLRGDADAAQIDGSEFKVAAGASSFNLNPETGVLIVYAPDRLQKEVQTLLDRSLSIAKRQVLLEATIVEVVLNNQYSQGIDWSVFNSLASEGVAIYQGGTAGGAAAAVEYLTTLLTVEAPEVRFDGELYGNLTNNGVGSELDTRLTEGGVSSADITRILALTNDRERGNAAARALRDSYVSGLRREANSGGNPLDRLVTFTPTQDEEEGTEIVLNAGQANERAEVYQIFTGGATYDVEQVNQQATALSSGGLVPNNPQNAFFTGALRQGDISAAVQLLDTFGDAKVLSSPRISALNHQPAILRVVDQEVYFNFTVDETVNEETGAAASRSFTVEENTVDVGFSMNVFPQISADGEIILNLKPAVTRVIDYRQAPILESFGTAAGGTQNLVPITRVRELESVISLRDGEIAVLGGLLEDRTGDDSSAVPGLSHLPGVGKLFERKNESTYKTEFVVFIRAKVINNPSINGDYSGYRHLLPNSDFILRDTESTLVPPAQLKTR